MAQIGQLPIGIFDEGGKFEPKQEFIDAARAQALEEGKKYIGDATGFEKFKDALFDIPDATIALVSGTAETLSEFALGLAKETLKGAQLSTTADPEKIKEIRESPGFTSYFDQLNFPRSNIYDSKISGVTPTDVAEFTGEVLAPVPAGIFAAGARFVPSLFKTAKVVKTQPLDDIIDIYTNASRRSERMALRSATKNDESLNNFIKTINELPAQKKSKTGERFGSAITDQTRYDENIIKQFANIHNSHNPFKIEYLKQSLGNQYKGLYNSARDKDLLSTNLKFKGEDITVQNILEKGKGKIKGDVSQDDILQQIEDVLIRYKKENPSSTGYELKVGGDFNLMKYIEEVNPNLATYLGNKKKSTYYNLIEALKTEGVLDNIGLPELTKMGVKTGTNVKTTVEGVAKQQPRSGKMELEKFLEMPMSTGEPIKYLPGLFKFSQKATGPEKKTQIIMAHGMGTGRIPKVIEDKINLIPNRFLKEVERPTFFLTSAGNRAHQKIENRLIPALIDKYELLGWKHSGKAGDDWVNVKKVDVSKDKELATKINELDDVINANREKLEKLDAYTLFYNPVKDKLVSYGKDISEIPGLSNLINKVKSGEKKLTGKIDVDRLKQGGIVGMKFMTRPLDGQR
jgi:hypothetical protein